VYYGTFAPGLQGVIAGILRERLRDVKIRRLLDGAAVFETAGDWGALRCFNNLFEAAHILERPKPAQALESHIRYLCSRRDPGPVIGGSGAKLRSFRIVCSFENQPARVREPVRAEAERYIARHSGLKVNRSGADAEFWFLYRREGFSICMRRLTQRGSYEKTLRPGELPPPLAYALCWLSGPAAGDAAADPFCGCGAIALQRVTGFPFRRFYASDIDRRAAARTREKLDGLRLGDRCRVQRGDLFDIFPFIPEGSLDRIITDPPWGMYAQTPVPIGEFYCKMIAVFARLLKPGGAAVVLTGAKEELLAAVLASGVFRVDEEVPLLVSGKKAAVFRLGCAPIANGEPGVWGDRGARTYGSMSPRRGRGGSAPA
jgi:SAM-dependent methyltransferase